VVIFGLPFLGRERRSGGTYFFLLPEPLNQTGEITICLALVSPCASSYAR